MTRSDRFDLLVRMYGDFGMPIVEIDPAIIPGSGLPLAELLVCAGLAPSLAAAGRFICSGRVSVDGEMIVRPSAAISPIRLKSGAALSLGHRVFRCAVMMKR